MTVYIHPKDSGPIDTAKQSHCNSCDRILRRKGGYFYKRDTRPSKRRNKYRNVCPHCKDAQNAVNVMTLKCGKCRTYFSQMDLKTVSRSDEIYQCPCCKENITEKSITIVKE